MIIHKFTEERPEKASLFCVMNEVFSVCDDLEYTYYYQSHRRPEIWLPRVALTIIQTI